VGEDKEVGEEVREEEEVGEEVGGTKVCACVAVQIQTRAVSPVLSHCQ